MGDTVGTQSFDATMITAEIDRDDPSIGQMRFLTDAGWYEFQLARGDLKRLARELQDALRATTLDLPEG